MSHILSTIETSRSDAARLSYNAAIRQHRAAGVLRRVSWVTWVVTIGTIAMWCITAYQVALAAGAHTFRDILASLFSNAENADVLVAYGAKYNQAILAGQYWRFVTPIFLHANILHIGLNMLNFIILGIIIERIFGHLRFLLIYLLTGIISIIASFVFSPQDVSVGASGAIFGIVGAYSVFMLAHRRAFQRGGIPVIIWLAVVVGINLGLGLVIPNVDNYAHLGGFLSGCILGWFFTPHYVLTTKNGKAEMLDTHSLARRWPLALLTIAATFLLALIALHFMGG